MIRTLTPLYVGRQPRFAAEATSYTAALQHLHCPHSLLWRDLLGHFLLSSVFPTLGYCRQLYSWVLNSWKAISRFHLQAFSPTFLQGGAFPGSLAVAQLLPFFVGEAFPEYLSLGLGKGYLSACAC